MGIEDPDADRLEQLLPIEDDEQAEDMDLGDPPLDADPSDVADQRRSVPLDDDPEE